VLGSSPSSRLTHSGSRELQNPPKRYGIIDLRELSSLCRFDEVAKFQLAQRRWMDDSLARERMVREGRWSEATAIGKLNFVAKVKSELGLKGSHLAAMRRFNSSKFKSSRVVLSGSNRRLTAHVLREQSEAWFLAVKMRC
jgi:hypothetical protein